MATNSSLSTTIRWSEDGSRPELGRAATGQRPQAHAAAAPDLPVDRKQRRPSDGGRAVRAGDRGDASMSLKTVYTTVYELAGLGAIRLVNVGTGGFRIEC